MDSLLFCTRPVGVANLAPRCGEAASAPLKGELLSVAKLRGFHTLLTNKPLRLTFVRHLPFQGRQGCFAPGSGGDVQLGAC